MANNIYHKSSHILIRGGDQLLWNAVSEPLYPGEVGYATNVQSEGGISVLKLGDGTNYWNALGVDENGENGKAVFFSGRGAGIRPAVQSEDLKQPLGAIRLHERSKKYIKEGLVIDDKGFLSLWKDDKGQTALTLDILTTDKLYARAFHANSIIESDFLELRETETIYDEAGNEIAKQEPGALLPGMFAGIRINNYNGKDSSFIVTNNTGRWGQGKGTVGNILDFSYFATIDPSTKLGPVAWSAVRNAEGHETGERTLKNWKPGNLSIKINNNDPIIYSPADSNVKDIFIPTAHTIVINTSETTIEKEYKVDSKGVITLTLPTVTGFAIDNWNKKLNYTTISLKKSSGNNKSILLPNFTEENGYIYNTIPLDDCLWDGKKISPVLIGIKYDGTLIDINKDKIAEINPIHYNVTVSNIVNNPVLLSLTTSDKDNTKTFTLTAEHKKVNSSSGTQDFELNDQNYTISTDSLVFDQWGHCTSTVEVKYSLKKIFERIATLEAKVKALEEASK